jgi:mannose-1-phosphate guanylyltransferase
MLLAAGADANLMPLTLTIPKSMLPIANKPLLEYAVANCVAHNIRELKISLHHIPELVDHHFRDGSKFNASISYSIEKELRGSAGSLKRVQNFFDDTFFVINAEVLSAVDLTGMLAFHRERKSAATVAFCCDSGNSSYPVDDQGRLLPVGPNPGNAAEAANTYFPGVYIFEPDVLQFVPSRGQCTIVDDLIPLLIEQGKPVHVFRHSGESYPVDSMRAYWEVNLEMAARTRQMILDNFEEIRPDILVHKSAKIAKSSLVQAVGPLFIGQSVEIENNVELIGPAVLGNEVFIETGATVQRSVVLANTAIGKAVEIRDSIVNQNYHLSIPNNFGLFVDEPQILKSHRVVGAKRRFNQFLIDSTDRLIAFALLAVLAIPFLLIALAIKLDSRGPVFYISRRLRSPGLLRKGKHWYVYLAEDAVKFYVFRTMYVDAEQSIHDLQNKYEGGPFVKIKNDPRVTRVGRFLRKTSIDELPLLWNVLRGEMSFVGIWGLPVYEAEAMQNEGLHDGKIDLSEVARLRFQGKLGLAGFWQARGRSALSAEERAIHDSMQAVLTNIDEKDADYLGEYAEFQTYKGYLKMLFETFKAVVKRTGAE